MSEIRILFLIVAMLIVSGCSAGYLAINGADPIPVDKFVMGVSDCYTKDGTEYCLPGTRASQASVSASRALTSRLPIFLRAAMAATCCWRGFVFPDSQW